MFLIVNKLMPGNSLSVRPFYRNVWSFGCFQTGLIRIFHEHQKRAALPRIDSRWKSTRMKGIGWADAHRSGPAASCFGDINMLQGCIAAKAFVGARAVFRRKVTPSIHTLPRFGSCSSFQNKSLCAFINLIMFERDLSVNPDEQNARKAAIKQCRPASHDAQTTTQKYRCLYEKKGTRL